MPRPVTLFTGQWADLTLDTMAAKAKGFGYDGLELACWGDHFEPGKAVKDAAYCKGRWDILNKHGMKCLSISNHLVGQAVCDHIDGRHKSILPPHVWGDGEAEGVRKRAAEEMKTTARAAAKLSRVKARMGSGFMVTMGKAHRINLRRLLALAGSSHVASLSRSRNEDGA